MHVAACFRLVSPLDFQEQEQEHAKRVPDGHGRSFGSWPWQKLKIKEIQTGSVCLAPFTLSKYPI